MSAKRSSIYEIAEMTGFSAMTVARAFSGSAPVAAATRTKIMEAAQKVGFRPNPSAQALRGGVVKSVGLLWPLTPPHSSVGQVRDISIRLYSQGYANHIADSLSTRQIVHHVLREFLDRRLAGVVLNDQHGRLCDETTCAMLREVPAPLLILRRHTPKLEFDQIIIDETESIRSIVRHFAAIRRKRVVFFHHMGGDVRLPVFLEELKAHGLPASENELIDVPVLFPNSHDYNYDAYTDFVARTYTGKLPFDGCICSTDEHAASLIRHFESRGIGVPEDIVVCGFNDSIMSKYFTPAIASVRRMEVESADAIADVLINRLNNPSCPPQLRTIHMQFIPRASAGSIQYNQ